MIGITILTTRAASLRPPRRTHPLKTPSQTHLPTTLPGPCPYRFETAPDREGRSRSVLVFRLMAESADARTHSHAPTVDPSPTVERVALETHRTERFDVTPSTGTTAARVEGSLVQRFTDHLKGMGHVLSRVRVRIPGQGELVSDPLDETAGVLYEAKASASRGDFRMALGQLVDCGRFVPARRAILLPSRPSHDLLELAQTCNVGVVWEASDGRFESRGIVVA